MSLLLDALKKAAEQKALNSGEADQGGQIARGAASEYKTQLKMTAEATASFKDPVESVEVERDPESNLDILLSEPSPNRGRNPAVSNEPGEDYGVEAPVQDDATDDSELPEELLDEDSTLIFNDDDVSEFLGGNGPQRAPPKPEAPDPHEYDQEIELSLEPVGLEPDAETAESSEDLSLDLLDREDSPTETHHTGHTENLTARTQNIQILADDRATTSRLKLHDVPDPAEEKELSSAYTYHSRSADKTRHNAEYREPPEDAVPLPDPTSTRTYAPDNYDRTLLKVENQDSSKLFAGMKAEADVAMTPDYAKKVFVSKMSEQRIYHYKIYTGLALSILIAIGIFGMFQFQDESTIIDDSLVPLKRDPLASLPKREKEQKKQTSFAQMLNPAVDTRTLQLIESANSGSPVPADAALSQQSQVTESTTEQAEPIEAEEAPQLAEPVQTATLEPPDKASAGAGSTQFQPVPGLKISTSNAIADKDRLLKEAYAAYQGGDSSTALTKYNQVLEIDPRSRNALLARAAIHVQNGRTSAAIRDYQTLLLDNPKDSLAMSSLIAVANYAPADSESQLKRMIREEPNSPHLNFTLANIYGAQDRWQEAQQYYFTALENNPTDPDYAYNLAVSLEHIAKPEAAVAYYRRALSNFYNGRAAFNRDLVEQRLEILGRL